MSEIHYSQSQSSTRLVFAIQFHEFIGVMLAPYLVHKSSTGEFSLSFKRLNSVTVTDHFKDCPPEQRHIVDLLDACRDEELMRKFSKKAKTVAGFYEELTESRLMSLIIPYIQKQTDKCLRILGRADIPLFFKGHKKDPVLAVPLKVQKYEAKAVFNFVRHPAESHYHLTLSHHGSDISLNSPDSLILVNTPGWALIAGNVYRLEAGIDGNKLKPFFTKEYITIPGHTEEKYYNGFVANAIKNFEVRTTGIGLTEKTPECEPVLSLENDLAGNPVLGLYFNYLEKKCFPNDNNDCWVDFTSANDSYYFRKITRNRDQEEQFAGILTKKGLANRENAVFFLNPKSRDNTRASLYSLIEWLAACSDELKTLGFKIRQDYLKKTFHTGAASLEIDLQEKNDWFDIHAYAVFGEYQIPFIQLKNHILSGKREYVLPDKQIAILPEEWFARYSDLFLYGKSGGDTMQLARHHFAIAERARTREGSAMEIFSLCNKSRLSVPSIPPELTGILRPYQLAGLSWMYFLHRHHLGGCLADDMGLGKTLQTLALLWKLKTEHGSLPVTGKPASTNSSPRTSLIIMPLSLMHNWENEINKFTPGLSCIKYSGINREAAAGCLDQHDIVLTTYGVVRNDLNILRKTEFFYLILDESQIIKNPDAIISRTVSKLRAKHRLVLTGTPVENSLTDLWSQLSFLNPGLLGGQQFFQEEFVYPVEKLHDEDKKNELRNLIEPFILRRRKLQVEKDLPELSEKIYYCEMNEDQKNLYESKKSEIRNGLFEKIDSGHKKDMKIDVLRGLMQLRLIANHPLLAGNERESSGKYTEVIRNIENLIAGGHKVLIFSQFVKHLRIYRDYFEMQKLKYSYLTGEINESRRQEVISEFQNDPDNLLFLISLKAGGTGLNLTAAGYVFILDPWWNPAVEQQAISRAHRIGQKKNVFSYKFISSGTVEEKILKLQHRKSQLAGDFINTNIPLKLFSDEEIIGLFE
jgi:superfamily II DNA or RNA helicase